VPVALLATGCASLPVASQGTRIHDRWVECATMGQGSPVVVFESGLGADMTAWEKVFPAVAAFTTVFAYSRPGYGASERAATARAGRVVVEELRATLKARGVEPPYLLVGHSLGGLTMQLFARRHPEEVAGLMLVDSTHPNSFQGFDMWRTPVWWMRLPLALYMSGTRGREFSAINQTGRDVLYAPELTGKPVTVLSAGTGPTQGDDLRSDVARLYPGSRHEWVDSPHNIQGKRPDVVIAAIREMVEQVRQAPR
jgi:pimeloyl-ACP methyl ester carboxylesterase